MSVRTRRQKAFGLFLVVLATALVAGAAGFATGYGTDASKRMALAEENRFLRAENAELAEIKIDSEKTAELTSENEALKAEVEELKKSNKELSDKLADTEGDLEETKEALSESEKELDKAEKKNEEAVTEAAATDTSVKSEKNFMDKITTWFIIGIIGVLVIMGVALILVPKTKREDEEESEEESEDDEEAEEEQYVAFEEVNESEEDAEDDATEELQEEIQEDVQEEVQEGVQTEIVFEETEDNKVEEEKGMSSDVPDSLEELMLESIKRNEQ